MLSTRPVISIHENGDYSRITGSKTPGRALKGRHGLQENVLQNGSMTANPKEKRVALQTPFRPGNSKIISQDAPASSKVATLSNARPLGDKTPRPNRQSLSLFTPGPRNAKPEKFALPTLQDEAEVTSPTQPPSATRKKLRSPRFSKTFETPITKGDHWNVSDVSIEEESSLLVGTRDTDLSDIDDSEPEYMPPKSVELPYEPPFELPDYKEVGRTFRTLAYSYPVDDSPYVYQFDSEDLLKGCDWSREHMHLNIREFDDDDEIFGPRKPEAKAKSRTANSSGATVKRSVSRLAKAPSVSRSVSSAALPSRPATSTAFRPPDLKLRSIPSRPGTSTSKSRPLPSRISSKKTASTRQDSEDLLVSRFGDELEFDDDFRFAV